MTGEGNPRATSPNTDRSLGPNQAPGCSLVEELGAEVDGIRQLYTDFGLRPYRVFSTVVGWTGGERHRGRAQVVSETEFLPTPLVREIDTQNRDLRSGGHVERGTVRLEQISARYTEDEVYKLFGRSLGPGEECYIEVRHDRRDGSTERRRYIVSGIPERKADRFEWVVRLTKQDENRTRAGAPR